LKNLHKIPPFLGILLAAISIVLMGLPGSAGAVDFPTPSQLEMGLNPLEYEAALERAQAENKLVLLYFWATWCGNCQNFSDNVLSDKAIIDALNENFIFVEIDIDKHKVTAEAYRVRAVPTTIFLESDGKPVSVLPGAVPGQVFTMVLDYMAGGSYKQMEFAEYFEEKYGGQFGAPSQDFAAGQETAPGQESASGVSQDPAAPNGALVARFGDYLRGLYQRAATPAGLRLTVNAAYVTFRGLTTQGYWMGAPALAELISDGKARQWLSLSKSERIDQPLETKVN
jgi:thioredoxin-related protein